MLHVTYSETAKMTSNSAKRVQKHRLTLRDAGLRPIQIWVPNIHSKEFVEECRSQSALAAKADLTDKELMSFIDLALNDLDGL